MANSTPKHYRDVHVISSRHPTRIFRCKADCEVDAIDALRTIADKLPEPEPGESRQIKTFIGGSN